MWIKQPWHSISSLSLTVLGIAKSLYGYIDIVIVIIVTMANINI
jgi:hypothetical protein